MASRRLARLVVLLPFALAACFDWKDPEPSEPRFLDRTCVADDCKISGSAERTTGLTQDSVGYQVGPGPGSLVIPFERQSMSGSFELELLMAGQGSVTLMMPEIGLVQQIEVQDEYEWYRISGSLTSTDAGSFENPVELEIEVADDGSSVDLADLKAVGIEQRSACSVSAPGR